MSAVAYMFGKWHFGGMRKLISLDHRKKERWYESLEPCPGLPHPREYRLHWGGNCLLFRGQSSSQQLLQNFFFFSFRLKSGMRRKNRIYLLHRIHFSTRYCHTEKLTPGKRDVLRFTVFSPLIRSSLTTNENILASASMFQGFFSIKISPQYGTAIQRQL